MQGSSCLQGAEEGRVSSIHARHEGNSGLHIGKVEVIMHFGQHTHISLDPSQEPAQWENLVIASTADVKGVALCDF